MLNVNKLLGNFYDKEDISKARFLAHAQDHLERLTNNNTTHQYDSIIAILTPLIAALKLEVGNEDTAINIRKAKTDTVDELTLVFSHTLSEMEGVIAHSCGGKTSESFKEFYPNGLTEYSKPNRDDIERFLGRITKATTKYSSLLDPADATVLLALETNYNAARSSQSKSKSDVANSKSEIINNRYNLEIGMSQSIHEIGRKYPGNVLPCIPLFNFGLLYSTTHHPHDEHDGTIAPQGTIVVINRATTDTVSIVAENPGTNADYFIWFGATSLDGDDSMSVKVPTGHSVTLKPSDIGGSSAKTFLLIKNGSSVNTASYIVTIIG